MVSMTSILAMVAAAATFVEHVQAHGYIAQPAPTWKNGENSEWVVEIPPLWDGPWNTVDGSEILPTFLELAAANNFRNVRTLMDGNSVFGEDCGYTDPDGTPQDPPSDGAATFSRGMVHAGPCEIWLGDEMVLQNDNCMEAYGDGTKEKISVLSPVDYSSCAPGGCMLRFYWLGLQRLNMDLMWQAYKNCIPLTGPGGGGSTPSGNAPVRTNRDNSDTPDSEDNNNHHNNENNHNENNNNENNNNENNGNNNNHNENNENNNNHHENNENNNNHNENNENNNNHNENNENNNNHNENNENNNNHNENNENNNNHNENNENNHNENSDHGNSPRSQSGGDSRRLFLDASSFRRRLFSADSKIRLRGDSPMMTPASSSKYNGSRRRRY